MNKCPDCGRYWNTDETDYCPHCQITMEDLKAAEEWLNEWWDKHGETDE